MIEQHYIKSLHNANGLSDTERVKLANLIKVYDDNLVKNQRRMEYYEDKVGVKDLGFTLPSSIVSRIGTAVGWAGKAVDMLSSRSVFDGFTASGEIEDVLKSITDQNDFSLEYSRSVQPQLVHGFGAWTVTRGEAGDPSVVINYHDATECAVLWNYRRKKVDCGLVIEDYEIVNGKIGQPKCVVFHTEYAVITLNRLGNTWNASRENHPMGRPLIEPMPYRPHAKRMGKSRITPALMCIIDEMKREIVRTTAQSELFSMPQKYILNASENAAQALQKWKAYTTDIFVATKDEDGETVQFGQLAQVSMEPHRSYMEFLMSRAAAETNLPVAAFGLTGNGYTSSDALRASTDDIIMEAENLNRSNAKALRNVARMALAIIGNKSIHSLTPDEYAVDVHWIDPAMPSVASITDAVTKQGAQVEWFPETSIYWEKLGYTEEERRRLLSEKSDAVAASSLSAILLGRTEKVSEPDADTESAS